MNRTRVRAISLALGAALALPFAVRGEEPRSDLAQRIRKATARAARALAVGNRPPEARTLVALALLRAGNHEDRIAARKILDVWWAAAWHEKVTNYELALGVSALEALSLERIEPEADDTSTLTRYDAQPLDPDIRKRLEISARALLESRVQTDGGGVGWGYRTARFVDEGDGKTKTKESQREDDDLTLPSTADNSNVQFSVLALHDAARGGIAIPEAVVSGIVRHFLACKTTTDARRTVGNMPVPNEKDRDLLAPVAIRWGYRDPTLGYSASMSFAALSSLAIARELGAKNEQLEPMIEGGLVRVKELISACGRPDGIQVDIPGWGAPYNFYSLEKALDLLEVREVEGKDWFAPLAERVLAKQGSDGLWNHEPIDTALYVLFLTRATVSKTRIEDHRTSSGGSSISEVYLPGRKKNVDAVALLRAYGGAGDVKAGLAARADAAEAVTALVAEGHGREACLLGSLAELLPSSQKRETAQGWLHDICGKDLKDAEVRAAASSLRTLHDARETKKTQVLRSAVSDEGLILPLRAFAAHALSVIPFPEAAPDIAQGLDRLAEDRLLGTPAGGRCARSLADALSALVRAKLPELSPKGGIGPEELHALAEAARAAVKKVLDEAVANALSAHAGREKDPAAWQKAKQDVAAQGVPALFRLVGVLEDPSRAKSAYAVLRAVTGELIPDDPDSWKAYLDSKKK